MSLFSPTFTALAETVLEKARHKKLRLVTAESCTGGLVAACLTAIAGSSDVFERGFVCYTNDAKVENLGVEQATLAAYGAVSAQTAVEMAKGALNASHGDIAVSVTGIAGPGGATPEKPVGLVYLACATKTGTAHESKNVFSGDRESVRLQALEKALNMLAEQIDA